MKRVTPDITDLLRVKFIGQLKMLRVFIRLWGKTTHQGVEVFTPRKYFYKPDRFDKSTKKLADVLRIRKDLEEEQEGIESAWLYLNPDNAKDTEVNWDYDKLASNFNKALRTEHVRELTGTITIRPIYYRSAGQTSTPNRKNYTESYIAAPIKTGTSNQEGLIAEIKRDFESYINAGHTISTTEEDPYKALLLSYVLRTTDIPYTITSVIKKPVGRQGNLSLKADSWDVNITITEHDFTASSQIIDKLVSDIKSISKENKFAGRITDRVKEDPRKVFRDTLNRAARWSVSDADIEEPDSSTVLKYWVTGMALGDHWLVDGLRGTYLKTSILTDPSMDREQLINYLYSLIDSDYEKKKVPKWKRLAAVVLVIVAFVGAAFSGGATLTLLGNTVWAVIAAGAVTISMATMYIGLMAAAFSLGGAEQLGSAMAKYSEGLAPLAKVAGIIAITAALVASIQQQLAKEAVAAAAKEGTKQGLASSIVQIARVTLTTAVEMVTGVTNLSNMSFQHTTKLASFVMTEYQKNENKRQQKWMKSKQSELDSLREAEEQAQMNDVLKSIASSYPELLAADDSVYAARYDRPYDWWSTKYHTGCMQANSVSGAWRISDENDIINDEIRGV